MWGGGGGCPLTVEIGHVDQVGVAFSQVSQQEAKNVVVPGQRRQVEGGTAIFVHQAGVSPRLQQHLHHLHLPCDHRQVQGSLQRRRSQRSRDKDVCSFLQRPNLPDRYVLRSEHKQEKLPRTLPAHLKTPDLPVSAYLSSDCS